MATMMAIIATATGWAQTNYGIKIDGVEITSANYQNITSANGFSAVTSEQGSVTYNPATNTLTLDGAQIDGALTTTGPMNIVLIGSNMLEAMMLSMYESAISLGGDCTISGFGSLNCSASNGEGIYIAANSTLTIKDCSVTVNATGSDTGYGGDGYDNGEGHGIRSVESPAAAALVVDHAQVSAYGTNGSIRYISSLTLNGCEITSPQGASFESGWQGVGNSGGIIKDQPVIIDIIPEPYAVYDGQVTMTIFYDKMKNRRTGTIWNVIPNDIWQSWYGNKDITTIDFDESFSNYEGMTILNNFFANMTNLVEIRHLNRLKTTNVTEMVATFNSCPSLTELDLTSFNTAKVTTMSAMFAEDTNLKTIIVGNEWSTESCVCDNMFYGCTSLVGSQGTTYKNSHFGATYAHIDHGESNPGYLTGVKEAYAVRDHLTGQTTTDLVGWPDYQTLTFYYDDQKSEWGQKEERRPHFNNENTFIGETIHRFAVYDLEGSNWKQDSEAKIYHVVFDDSFANYNGLTDLSNFFSGLDKLSGVGGFENLNTQNVTTMEKMFYQCNMAQLDLHFLNTENVTNMKDMFNGCSYLNTIRCNDNWQRDGLVSTDMFLGCTELKGYDAAHTDAAMANPEGYFTADEPYAVLDDKGTLTFYYDNGKELMQVLQTNYDWHLFSFTGTEWVGPNGIMWNDGTNSVKQDIKKVVFDESFALYHGLETTKDMFNGFYYLKSIEGMENLNTENVTCMDQMFANCMDLKQIDLSHFDTSKVTSMMGMFGGCSGLQELDVSSFNTAKVTDMRKMFFTCSFLTTIYCKTDWKLIAENNGITLQSAEMFKDCISLKGGMGTAYSDQYQDINYAHPDNVNSPGFFTCTVEKGNLNDDNNIDDVDVEILTDALLGKIAITADLIAKGDMNYDGALTIADVTLLVDAILKQE